MLKMEREIRQSQDIITDTINNTIEGENTQWYDGFIMPDSAVESPEIAQSSDFDVRDSDLDLTNLILNNPDSVKDHGFKTSAIRLGIAFKKSIYARCGIDNEQIDQIVNDISQRNFTRNQAYEFLSESYNAFTKLKETQEAKKTSDPGVLTEA